MIHLGHDRSVDEIVDAVVQVTLPGGALTIRHDEEGGIHMAGPASESYRGSFELDDFG